jgi:enterochelin esterase-like enzyme
MRAIGLLLTLALAGMAADTVSFRSLMDLSKKPSAPEFKDALINALHEDALDKGTAWMGEGTDFIWAVRTPGAHPSLEVDGKSRPSMKRIPGTDIWFATGSVTPAGKLHFFEYKVDGQQFGGNTQAATTDYTKAVEFPVFGPDSYSHPGVPQGKLSEKLTFTSQIYDGMTNDYWIYVPAQYDPNTPAALMVFQDGQGYVNRDSPRNRTLDVLDNLIAQKKIPVMIVVFINPGDISGSPGTPTYNFVEAYGKKWNRTLKDSMRSTLYDTVSDRYPRFLRDEILADVSEKYNIRKDAYSRSITGLSSGGICSFNAAWQQPDQFARVISWIGSFSAIQWKEDPSNPDGGQDYPDKILREPKRNIRVWLQDGSEDLDLRYGNWPLANLRMANALKAAGYDFHLSFGRGTHNSAHGAAEFPTEMTWLWRDYDPSKTSQTFEQDPGEKTRPPVRVSITNPQDAQ